jgi:tetratricopeptide (TPR) repeat protein
MRIKIVVILMFIWISGFSQISNSNYLLIMKACNNANQPQKALDFYNKNLTSVKSVELQTVLGQTYYKLGNYKQAANIFYEINKADSKKCNYELALCYAHMGKAEQSTKHLHAYLQQRNKIMQRTIKSDKAFEPIENTKQWRELWQTDYYSKYDLMYEDAQYEYDHGNYEDALEIVDKLNDIRKSMVKAYELKAKIYLKIDEYQNALSAINAAINKRDKVADYYAVKAEIEVASGKPKKALKNIKTAIELDSTKINYFFIRSKAYLKSGQTASAKADLEALMKIVPDFKIYNLAGEIYFESGDYQSSLKAYNKCVESEKYNPDIYIARGDVYAKIYAYEYAEKDYTMALDFYPFNGELYYKRGVTRRQQRKYDKACSDFRKAFKYKYMKADDAIRRYCR